MLMLKPERPMLRPYTPTFSMHCRYRGQSGRGELTRSKAGPAGMEVQDRPLDSCAFK